PGAADGGDAVLRKQLSQHRGVLIGNRGAELREHPGWQSKPCRDRVEMPRPRAGSGPDQEFMGVAGGDNLVDERVDRWPGTVDDALATDLDDGGGGQDPVVC